MAQCWKCKATLEVPRVVPFRATCAVCDVDLHVCVNCRHYAPGKPNECAVPGTEWVRDREKSNLCEDFALKEPPPSTQKFSRLFKDYPNDQK